MVQLNYDKRFRRGAPVLSVGYGISLASGCRFRCAPGIFLLALLQLNGCGYWLAIAQHLDFNHISYFAAPQCISEVIEVIDWFVAELHQDVSCFQAGLGCGRARFNVGELYAAFHLAEIGNRSEVGAVAAASRAA